MSKLTLAIDQQAELIAQKIANQVYQNILAQYKPLIDARPDDTTIKAQSEKIASDKAQESYQANKQYYVDILEQKLLEILLGTPQQTQQQPTQQPIQPQIQPTPVTFVPAQQKAQNVPPPISSPPTESTQKIEAFLANKDNDKKKENKNHTHKRKIPAWAIIATVGILAGLLLAAFLSGAIAQTVTPAPEAPVLSFYPNNSHIIQASGENFSPNTEVRCELYQNNMLKFTIPSTVLTTDSSGSFSSILIIPTYLFGDFNLVATTGTLSKSVPISVPSFVAKASEFNATGNIRIYNGTQGEPGKDASSTIGIIAVGVSVVTLFLLTAVCAKPSFFLNRTVPDSKKNLQT